MAAARMMTSKEWVKQRDENAAKIEALQKEYKAAPSMDVKCIAVRTGNIEATLTPDGHLYFIDHRGGEAPRNFQLKSAEDARALAHFILALFPEGEA